MTHHSVRQHNPIMEVPAYIHTSNLHTCQNWRWTLDILLSSCWYIYTQFIKA